MNVTIKEGVKAIHILINGLPHIILSKGKMVGFHSWEDENNKWFIKFVFKRNEMIVEYDNKDKWIAVLALFK